MTGLDKDLATLREERDVALRYAEKCVDEAVAAEERVARLTQEREEALDGLAEQAQQATAMTLRADAAEARCARLQQALIHHGYGPRLCKCANCEAAGPDTPADSPEDEWFVPEGDRQCGVVHKNARATCMKRRGHEGSHATPQGTWIDGPWCEYPADSQEDKT